MPESLAVPQLSPDATESVVRSSAPVTIAVGAPSTGKSTLAIQRAAHVVKQGAHPDAVVVIGASRVLAAHLRVAASTAIGQASSVALGRTLPALAFSLVQRAAARRGLPPHRLLSGADQDTLLADLLEGHREGYGAQPLWPAHLAEALPTRTFRQELRETLMRAVELNINPQGLQQLAQTHSRPEWEAVASVLDEYAAVVEERWNGVALDPSSVLVRAIAEVEADARVLTSEATSVSLAHVVVDDAQELTAAGVHLLGTLRDSGVHLTLLGDPDVAVNTFRGALPGAFLNLAGAHEPLILPRCVGVHPALLPGWRQAASRVGVTSVAAHRAAYAETSLAGPAAQQEKTMPQTAPEERESRPHSATPQVEDTACEPPSEPSVNPPVLRAMALPEPPAGVSTGVARSTAHEARGIAAWLTEHRYRGGATWSDFCVVVRGQRNAAQVRRELESQGIPVHGSAAGIPVYQEEAVEALLTAIDIATHLATGPITHTAEDALRSLALSPLVGADRAELRRLTVAVRRWAALHHAEDPRGPHAVWDQLLSEESPPLRRVYAGESLRQLVAIVQATRRALERIGGAEAVIPVGMSVEDVLWAPWQASGQAEMWQRRALSGGRSAAGAHRDLDAVVALFAFARRYAERQAHHTVAGFVQHLRDQEVAEDRVSAAASGHGVVITTASGAAGRRWHAVAIAGVTEGVWPNPTLRGSLLAGELLTECALGLEGTRTTRQAVIHDEARMFLMALSRASHAVLVTAVDDGVTAPSEFHRSLRTLPGHHSVDLHRRPLTMRMAAAELRLRYHHFSTPETATPDSSPEPLHEWNELTQPEVAGLLYQTWRQGVTGAHPLRWRAASRPTAPTSTPDPNRAEPQHVAVSPSSLDLFTQCPRRWFMQRHGGDQPDSTVRARLGTLVHYVAECANLTSRADAFTVLERWWHRLDVPPGWHSQLLRQQAERMVEGVVNYHEAAQAQGWEQVGTELTLNVPLTEHLTVTGRIDRLEADHRGRLRVVDFKTGSPYGVTEAEHNPQLALYQVGVESGGVPEHGHVSGGAQLVFVGTSGRGNYQVKDQPPLAEHDDPAWARTLLTDVAQGMRGPTYPATPSPTACRYCPFQAGCPGHTAQGDTP